MKRSTLVVWFSSFGLLVTTVAHSSSQVKHSRELLDKTSHQCTEQPDASEEFKENNKNSYVWSSELHDWTLGARDERQDAEAPHCIWPEDCGSEKKRDRIVDQLRMRLPEGSGDKIFKIMPPDYSYPVGSELFTSERCPVDRCTITYDNMQADALIFQNSDVVRVPPKWRRMHQVWIAYLLESPPHTFDLRYERAYRGDKHQFNWTATYRSDSDIVTPYSKFVPYHSQLARYKLLKEARDWRSNHRDELERIYDSASGDHKRLIAGKSGKIAWFASNCNAANERLRYAHELSKYVQVDIFGRCGQFTCDKRNQSNCLATLNKQYKFYLSFENSNCHQYVTEKLYKNALGYNDLNHLLLPIVMGSPRSDYEQLAPPASFIHVDDFDSPKELASYLHLLDQDDSLYYFYFHWKTVGRFIDTKFMCRVCAMLHESYNSGKVKSYPSIINWWWMR